MLTGAHFLLTYKCDRECAHCFLYCGPYARGTFTLEQLRTAFTQLDELGSIDEVYFEGGEPFLFYPLLLEGVRLAGARRLEVGIVTNAYWATTVDDAIESLRPLVEAGLTMLSISRDALHGLDDDLCPADNAMTAARTLGLEAGAICIDEPAVLTEPRSKGEPVIGGDVLLRGRAVDTLAANLPRRAAADFDECADEELRRPKRVHLDAFGHVHICQGISMGNLWQTPLAELLARYDAESHPICGPLLRGGPAELARVHGEHAPAHAATACHLCFQLRRALVPRFPDQLAPSLVYGPL